MHFVECCIEIEAAIESVLQENVFLDISKNSQAYNFMKKDTLAQAF